MEKLYFAIDLKSFYASVECVALGADPLTFHLVVADPTRSEKTICLAVSPALKKLGIPGRPRLFEVDQKLKEINQERMRQNHNQPFRGKAYFENEVSDLNKKVSTAIATPRMAEYIRISTMIYGIYLKYFSAEDIHVYSVDEVFIDVTSYLHTYQKTPVELAKMVMNDVLQKTGITATTGIGTNLYLAKVAMDILAKHVKPDAQGARIAYLDENLYRRQLWTHQPITDFWRVGVGTARRLEKLGLHTMGDIARCSLGSTMEAMNEDLLYQEFGINAELLIDHAWGKETCTIKEIKQFEPKAHSFQSGQVLACPYTNEKARLIVKEMVDQLVLDMTAKNISCRAVVLSIGYDIENIKKCPQYVDSIVTDWYGRQLPKSVHGGVRFDKHVNSETMIMHAVLRIFDQITDPHLTIRRIYIGAEDVVDNQTAENEHTYRQMDLFSDTSYEEEQALEDAQKKDLKLQQTINTIRQKFGKNSVVKLMNLEEDARQMERNDEIGGHRA